jgi:Secretion system C-terminal sorting domain
MRLYLLFWLLLKLTFAQTQSGFSKVYDLGWAGASFLSNIAVNQDTLLTFGPIINYDSIANKQGLSFTMLDTNGLIISNHTLFDSLGGDLTADFHCKIHKRNDASGYVIPAMSFTRSTGVLCFLNTEGQFIKMVEYHDNSSRVDFYSAIIETESGFLILGNKQRYDYQIDLFLMKTDKQGNKLWEKYYDNNNGRQWYYGGYFLENENSIIIGVHDTEHSDTALPLWSRKGILLALDTLGNEKWRWESEISLNHAGIIAPKKRSDGNWMYSTSELQIYPTQNFVTNSTKIIVRDSNFNLLLEKVVSPIYSEVNGFADILPTDDGNWLAIGILTTPINLPSPNAQAGWMYKFSDNLENIWNRIDTVFYNNTIYTDHWLLGAAQLQSGSIIAAGFVNVYYPIPKSWGWIIKISKDGCLDTLNCIVSSTKTLQKYKYASFKVYPNPTTNKIFYENEDNIQWDKIEIINLTGQIQKMQNCQIQNEIDLSQLISGLYMIKFTKGNYHTVRRVYKE